MEARAKKKNYVIVTGKTVKTQLSKHTALIDDYANMIVLMWEKRDTTSHQTNIFIYSIIAGFTAQPFAISDHALQEQKAQEKE
jgi:hypothetical protein